MGNPAAWKYSSGRGDVMPDAAAEIAVAGWAEAVEAYFERGWTDGLPVVPATADSVRPFLAAIGRAPGDIVLRESTRRRTITAEKVAINAVLAGCRPEYMPVLIAALEAMADPAFTLHGAITSTGGSATLVVVNGPIRHRLGLNAGGNVFGPGCRANATIGRAIRLITLNCLGALPGLLDRSTQGHPGQVLVLHRRARGRESLGTAARDRAGCRASRARSPCSQPRGRTTC
jgi:hypothetical protein